MCSLYNQYHTWTAQMVQQAVIKINLQNLEAQEAFQEWNKQADGTTSNR